MIAVYIASPYTDGDPVVNVRRSLLAANELVSYGYAPYCPLLSHFWHFLTPHPYTFWTTLDLEWVKRCDAVLRLPGFSAGADAELKLAVEIGKPIFFSIEALVQNMPPGGGAK